MSEKWDHYVPEVGGPLNERRLRQIARRGWWLRNQCVSEAEVFEYEPYGMDETPSLTYVEGHEEGRRAPWLDHIELHHGCGDGCPVVALIPYDGDADQVDHEFATAIAHAGQDLLDLAREVKLLRSLLGNCVDAIDRLMSDSDLDDDDSFEMKAMQNAVGALVGGGRFNER